MASQTAHPYDNFDNFIRQCSVYVNSIEKYTGDDALEPWYQYILWMEENFVVDFTKETLFERILVNCVGRFEAIDAYRQDRRLIKMFLKYVHFQDSQNEHYELMYGDGYGTKVADLYINWAHFYDMKNQFEEAEKIFVKGIKAKAEPFDLLESSHKDFGFRMAQRIMRKTDQQFQQSEQARMQTQLELISSLRITGSNNNGPKSIALQKFGNAIETRIHMVIPFSETTNSTPETTGKWSVVRNLLDSARKMRRNPRPNPMIALRIDFNDNNNYTERNIPPQEPVGGAYLDPYIGTYRKERPGYDKIMLVPATNVAFSLEELRAYNWFKKRNISNAFTKEQDKFWSVGYDVPLRYANVFARKNFPQPEWICPRISSDRFLDEEHAHKFMFSMYEHYPADSTEEYSLDEIMWKKRKMNTNKPIHKQVENVANKSARLLNRTVSQESKLSPIVEMDLSYTGEMLDKRASNEEPKKRKSSMLHNFDALNDTCTTQMFGNMALHSTAIAFPGSKMARFENDESIASTSKSNDFAFPIYEDKTMTVPPTKYTAPKDPIHDLTVGNKENIIIPDQTNQSNGSAVNRNCEKIENKNNTQPMYENAIPLDRPEMLENLLENANSLLATIENFKNTSAEALEYKNACHNHSRNEVTDEIDIESTKKLVENLSQTLANLEKVQNPIEAVTPPLETHRNVTNSPNVIKERSVINNTIVMNSKLYDVVQKGSETFYLSPLGTSTTEFEELEAMCAISPDASKQTLDLSTPKRHTSLAKNVTISAAHQKTLDHVNRISGVYISAEEQECIMDNPAISDRTRLNWTRHQSVIASPDLPSISEDIVDRDNDENDIGKSIYVPQPALEFDEKDADWAEVTQFIAEGHANNDYVVEEVNMDETRTRIDTHILNLRDLNPFDPEVQKDVLNDIGFIDKLNGANNFHCTMMNIVQPLKPRSSIEINNQKYQIRKLIGTGAYGKVFFVECPKTKQSFAFKQQRPPNLWEYYVCLQIHTRIMDENIRKGFMSVDFAVVGNNATIFASTFSKYGTILNVCNKIKQATNKSIDECIVMILTKQMLTIVEEFHKAKFIHADVKPDNFLLMDKLSSNYKDPELALQLIDFGQSIDMNYFKGHVFWAKVKTENFVCTQMMEDKPWTFHCDWFCLASTVYTMVAGKYMVVSRRSPGDPYKPQKLPRYVNGSLWDEIFDTLINIPSLKKMPSISNLQMLLDEALDAIGPKKVSEAIVKFNKALDL